MSSVLITGANGFLGRHISKDLAQRGFDVYSRRRTDGDVRESATWEQFPGANYLIHLAGTTFVPASWDSPTEFVHSNLISTSHALDYCRKHKTKMIFFSTYLYSKTARQPTIEEEKIDPANPYALSKLMGEQLCTFYANHFDIFNIGTGISHSVSDLINLLGDIVGQEFRITSLSQERFGEINSTRADISKAQKVLNWYPNWELKAGLERVWKESI